MNDWHPLTEHLNTLCGRINVEWIADGANAICACPNEPRGAGEISWCVQWVGRVSVKEDIESRGANSGELELRGSVDGLENAWICSTGSATSNEGSSTSDETCSSNNDTESLSRRTTYETLNDVAESEIDVWTDCDVGFEL